MITYLANLNFMNKISFLTFVTLICLNSLSAYSQEQNFCGQQIITENIFKAHPEWRAEFERTLNSVQNQNSQHGVGQAQKIQASPTHTVPVVFHILHIGGVENISDAQVIDQVAILNRDFQKQNQDTILVVPSFTNNIANVGFQFELATIDPLGNCTNGIIRHFDPITTTWPMPTVDFTPYAYTWPPNKYLNVYVVNNIEGLNGAYTILPGVPVPSIADAIVIEHNVTGSIGTANVANSRVLTHEVAHWFNVLHIWGSTNSPGVACGDDGVTDTPITKGFISCSTSNAAVCTPSVQENVQNYMDYSPCKIMFTNGQASRMLTCITGTINNRHNLSSSSNLLATGITTTVANCIPLVELGAIPAKTVCLGNPMSVIAYTSNANASNYFWSASAGVIITNSTSPTTSVSFSGVGNYTITCVASNTNGASTASMIVMVKTNTAQVSGSYPESFESAGLPLNWMIHNPNTMPTNWSISNFASSLGGQSMFVNAETAPTGSEEIFETPSYDFLNNPGATFTFKTAYARQTATHNDVFKVQASKNCGGTWSDIYVPTPAFLSTGSGGVSSSLFVPNSSQWKAYNLTLHPAFSSFKNESNVIIRFYFKEDITTGYGNRLYLDEVNFSSPAGINEFTQRINLNVYPNPVNDELSLQFDLHDNGKVRVSLLNALGSEVMYNDMATLNPGTHKIKLDVGGRLHPGVYFLNVDINNVKVTRKIMVLE